MKLSKIAILAIRGMGIKDKEALADSVGVNIKTLYRYINDNDDSLTKAAALEFIREKTGLTADEILEKESEVKEPQN